MRDSDLEMEELVRSSTHRILKSALRVARAHLRLLCWARAHLRILIPALLCKGALLCRGALDFEKDALSLMRREVRAPLRVNAMGHYIVSAVEFGRGPDVAASYLEWSFVEKRPDLSGGGLHLPPKESGPIRLAPPREFPACTAVTLGDARNDSISDPKKIIMKLHANWGHASATGERSRLRRIDWREDWWKSVRLSHYA